MVTYSDILAYSRQVAALAKKAGEEFSGFAAGVSFDDWSEAADELRYLVESIVNKYGLGSSELGAQWYEYCRMNNLGGYYEAAPIMPTKPEIIGVANQRIDKLFIGEIAPDVLTEELADVVVMETKNVARNTVMGNMDIEYRDAIRRGDKKFAKKMTYARVPQGATTCAWCCMLASRGYVYSSEFAAGGKGTGNEYHDGCDCVAVPFSGPNSIKGYDYSKYLDVYNKADRARINNENGTNPYSDELEYRVNTAKEEHNEKRRKALEEHETNPDVKVPPKWQSMNETLIVMRYQNPGMH